MTDQEFLLIFDSATPQSDVDQWVDQLTAAGADAEAIQLADTPIVITSQLEQVASGLPQPSETVVTHGELRLSRRDVRPAGSTVEIGSVVVGDGSIAVFAGPCAVESEPQLVATANIVTEAGAVGLRGGAFKPRTSPYSFQGLRWAGLELLAEARKRTGLPVLTEVIDPRHVERFAEYVDGFQIGTRSMQNFSLLREVGRTGLPVVLKRGFGCTIDELLLAGEYVLAEGNDRLILCERGIRSFDSATRFTLDLSAVPLIKQRSHLPVMVDPSHAVGIPALVEPMSLGAAAVGADALLVDVHVDPDRALCDGKQALLPNEFQRLMGRLEMLALGVGRKLATRSTLDAGKAA